MRLFVAVWPPDEALAELDAVVKGLRQRAGADELRWAERAGWHFTLAFLGEVAQRLLPELEERLERAARRHGPYALRLAGGGRFGDRTLWAALEGDVGGLARLAASVQAAARRAKIQVAQEHRYHPHLTVARNRGGADLRPFAAALAPVRGAEWTADAVTLVRSHPPAPGAPGAQPHYETLRTWPLGR